MLKPEVGTRNFFLSPQSQLRKLKEALSQLFKECCSATATLQFCNRNFFFSPQLQLHNSRALLPQFLVDF